MCSLERGRKEGITDSSSSCNLQNDISVSRSIINMRSVLMDTDVKHVIFHKKNKNQPFNISTGIAYIADKCLSNKITCTRHMYKHKNSSSSKYDTSTSSDI
jgi:hypothetical protein